MAHNLKITWKFIHDPFGNFLTQLRRISLINCSSGGSTTIGPKVWPMHRSKWAEMLSLVDGSDVLFLGNPLANKLVSYWGIYLVRSLRLINRRLRSCCFKFKGQIGPRLCISVGHSTLRWCFETSWPLHFLWRSNNHQPLPTWHTVIR